jgi:hypothetical protein
MPSKLLRIFYWYKRAEGKTNNVLLIEQVSRSGRCKATGMLIFPLTTELIKT